MKQLLTNQNHKLKNELNKIINKKKNILMEIFLPKVIDLIDFSIKQIHAHIKKALLSLIQEHRSWRANKDRIFNKAFLE